MPAHLLVEEARRETANRGRLQLRVNVPIATKRAVVLAALNRGVPMREVVIRALEREVLLDPEAAGLTSPDPDPTTEEGPSVS